MVPAPGSSRVVGRVGKRRLVGGREELIVDIALDLLGPCVALSLAAGVVQHPSIDIRKQRRASRTLRRHFGEAAPASL